MTNLLLNFSAALPDARIAQITREMSRDLARAGISAKPIEVAVEPGERGDVVLLGQLALGLVSSGAVTALIQCLKAYLSRERSLAIKLARSDGLVVEITSHNVDIASVQEALRAATSAK
jgi:hypothetical protein